ncbi:MAG: DUF202 domain-containing protein [Nodosilinea sp.]
MNTPQPPKLGTTNELAKERNRAAAERTINAWSANCLSLIGIGVAIDQISRSLRQQFPNNSLLVTEAATHATSLVFVGVGVALLGLALMQHRLVLKSIEREDYVLLSVNALNHIVVTGVLLTGCLGFFAILFLL